MKMPLIPPTREAPTAGLDFKRVLAAIQLESSPTQDGKYRHWDTLRHLTPPSDLSVEEWWVAIKFARRSLYKPLVLQDAKGNPFVYATPIPALEMLHRTDRDASGAIQAPAQVTEPDTRETYLIRSLVEEAITSSQLEGASTTRKVAKEMIREGREPRDRSERMILNNYQGMQFMRGFIGKRLTPQIVMELQAILTERTLDDDECSGRLRRDEDGITVTDEVGNVLHMPPKASELSGRLQRLCAFANGYVDERSAPPGSPVPTDWIHPVLRAILIHFMIGYDHPFVDGNGRTARALFYWSMATQGYWLAEFVSISRILKKAKAQYARSYLYTESDDNDTTYFILYQLRVFLRAISDLHLYLAHKADEIRRTDDALRRRAALHEQLNDRQLALMSNAIKHQDAKFTIASHRRSHGVSYETARTDLRALAKQGLLTERKRGRTFVYVPADDLTERLGAGVGTVKRAAFFV